jgi:holo-[acyl-carrier protein] synthase
VIVGIGVDVVNVPRFTATMATVAGFKGLFFAAEELLDEDGRPLPSRSLAVSFAAKQAASKALGKPPGLRHTDCQLRRKGGEPQLFTAGSVAKAAKAAGVTRWHVSMSLEGDMATAMVIAEREADESVVKGVEVQ